MRTMSQLRILVLMSALAAMPVAAQMGTPNTTPGAVVRVVHVRIKPGRADAFWADVRQHLLPVYEQEKAQGIISDYTFQTKSTLEGENDWTVGISLLYPNYAALDNVTARTDPITIAHYGSVANRTAAALARVENAVTVESYLVRRVTPNPWK